MVKYILQKIPEEIGDIRESPDG